MIKYWIPGSKMNERKKPTQVSKWQTHWARA